MSKPIDTTSPQSTTTTPAIILSDPILPLAIDVIFNCLSFLSVKDVTACSAVCKTWNQLTNDNRLWNLLLTHHFPHFRKKVGLTPVKNAKQVYQNQSRISTNFANGLYATTNIPTPTSQTFTFIASKEGLLVSGTSAGSIVISDLKIEKPDKRVKIIQAHTTCVIALAFTNQGHLISCSDEGEIKIWDLNTDKPLNTFQVQPGSQHPVVTKEDLLILGSGYNDNTINIWDLKTNQYVATLQGHTNGIHDLVLTKKGLLISSSWDGTIKIWDLKTRLCLKTIPQEEDTDKLRLVLTEEEDQLISGSDYGKIQFWDLNTYECIHTLEAHASIASLHVTQDGHLISSSNTSEIKIWDLKTLECLTTLKGLQFLPYNFVSKEWQLISPHSFYPRIQVWDFTVPDKAILNEFAEKLKNIINANSVLDYQIWLEQFLKVSKKLKEKIYQELYEIQKPLIIDGSLQYGESALLFTATRQIAKAITNYMAKLPDVPENFGPVEAIAEKPPEKLSEAFRYFTDILQITQNQKKVFFPKSEFSAAFVEHAGLVNTVDLQAIGINPKLMENLALLRSRLKILTQEKEALIASLQTSPHKAFKTITPVKDSIESLLVNPLPLIELGEEVTTVPLDSLMLMQSSLTKHKTLLEQVMGSPKSSNQFVGSGDLFDFANSLLVEFAQFEQRIKYSQIELLEAYLSQPYLNATWEKLQAQGITQATQLAKQLKKPSEFYRM